MPEKGVIGCFVLFLQRVWHVLHQQDDAEERNRNSNYSLVGSAKDEEMKQREGGEGVMAEECETEKKKSTHWLLK